MKILVLSTGGTIGSATKDGVMSPDKNATALLVLLYESSFQDVAEFDCESVSDILSENVTEPFYEKLINRLLAVDTEKYDGVIVARNRYARIYVVARGNGLPQSPCSRGICRSELSS